MGYVNSVSDLPEQSRIVFKSSEDNEETMNRLGITQIVRQIGKGPFRSDLIACSGGQTDFFAEPLQQSGIRRTRLAR